MLRLSRVRTPGFASDNAVAARAEPCNADLHSVPRQHSHNRGTLVLHPRPMVPSGCAPSRVDVAVLIVGLSSSPILIVVLVLVVVLILILVLVAGHGDWR